LRVGIQVAAGLLNLGELRLILVGIEEINATLIGQAQTGGDLGCARFGGLALGFEFLIEFGCLRGCAREAAFLVFFGGVPVDHVFGNLFPLAALGAEVAHTFAVNFILGD